MAIEIATWLVWAITGYSALGLLFAVPFLLRGVRAIDPAAREGSLGFRIVILPGVVAFWPLLMSRWIGGGAEPPEESGAHRDAAQTPAKGATA